MNKLKSLDTRIKQQLKTLPPLEQPSELTVNTETYDVVVFDLAQTGFLEEYQRSPDIVKVRKLLKLKKATIDKWLTQAQFVDRIKLIQKRYYDAITNESKTVVGWQVDIIKKMEKMLDEGDTKVASALSNSMGNLLKATGSFSDGENIAPEVNINIDLGKELTASSVTKTVT